MLEFEVQGASPAQVHGQGPRLFFEAEPDQQCLDPYHTRTAKPPFRMVVRVHARTLLWLNMKLVLAWDMGCPYGQQPHEIHFQACIYANNQRVRINLGIKDNYM